MRVKRQRRKLRGKYSGNCLSCAAKWSKCWYIASVDNQREWETRLNKTVSPGADEVCFQCWDAKIRTSPKRKIHFKTELSLLNDSGSASAVDTPGARCGKRVDGNKRRLSGDFDCTVHAPEFPTKRSRSGENSFGGLDSDELYEEDFDEEDDAVESSIIFDEENAVILLSTAFRTLPEHINDVNINININRYHDADEGSSSDKSKRRGAYYCGKCGKLKKGHVCDEPIPQSEVSPSLSPVPTLPELLSPPLSSISIQLSTVSQMPIPTVAAFAQPVVS